MKSQNVLNLKGEILLSFRRIGKNYTPKITDNNGNVLHNSIARIEKMELGGIDQYVMIRGKNKDNPILLFLHGGPGLSHIPFARKFQKELEENFIVVNWDQRGAGLSYSKKISEETMNVEQFISDTYKLITTVMKKFKKEKIYLAGHSWGSYLGVLMVERYPELFHAYIGISQVTNVTRASKLEYLYILDLAQKDNNEKAIRELQTIDEPPYKDINKFKTMRKWFNYYEGDNEINLTKIILKGILFDCEYRFFDIIKYLKGLNFSQKNITDEVYNDLFKELTSVEIPIYFCVGRHDYITPLKLVESYMESLSAPVKKLYIFEKSAHCPHLQESEKLNTVMNLIRKEINNLG